MTEHTTIANIRTDATSVYTIWPFMDLTIGDKPNMSEFDYQVIHALVQINAAFQGTAVDAFAVTGNATVGGTLAVTGASTLTGNVTASGTLAVTGNTTVGGTLGVTGASTLTGNVTASGTLAVTGASTLTGNVTCEGTLTVDTTTTLTGNVTASGTLGVTGLITATAGVDATTDVRARTVFADGDEGTGIATTIGFTNVANAADDTGATLGNYHVNGSGGTFTGWIKVWVGTTAGYVPYWVNA